MKFTESHEWVSIDGQNAIIGISDHAQEQLSDIIFVDLPEVGTEIQKGNEFMSIESVKSASDIYAPISGTITEINERLTDEPELVNSEAENEGWLIKISVSDSSELDELMDKEAYLNQL